MRSIAISITIMLAAIGISHGQFLYKEGAILTSPFDTVRGEIKYTSYNKASTKCIFRDSTGRETTFLPGELFGYIIEDQLYFRSKAIGSTTTQFLEVVYQGTLILYAFRDSNQKNFFYLENPTTGAFEILRQKTLRNGSKKVVIRIFEDVLKETRPKSELIADEIQNVDYEHKSLSNLLLDYDERYASFQGRIFQGYKKRWPPRIAPFIQLGRSKLTLNGFDDQERTTTLGLGVKFQKEISRGTGRLHLDVDLSYHMESYQDVVFSPEDFAFPESIISNGFNIALFAADLGIQGDYELRNTLSLDKHVISLPLNLKYYFPSKRLTFSINGGLNPTYALSQNGQIDGQVIQNEQVILGVNSRIEATRFRPGLNFGAGFYYHRKATWFIDFQYSPAWLDQGNLNFSTSFIRIGYLFD